MAKQMACTLCGYVGEVKQKARGNGLVEFILWWFFIVPGLLYSIWSRGGKGKSVCPKCGNEHLIPLDSPQAQKLMADNPNISKESLEPEKSSNKTRNIMIGVVVGVLILLVIAISTSMDDARERMEKENRSAQQTEQNAKTIAQKDLPAEPQARIETIVKNVGAYEVTLFGKNPNAKAVAPFEVIINTDAGSCALAKQINFDVMKALFTDEIAKKNIARVRFNARKYVSTSLGGSDAKELPSKAWAESGPTNFFKVLIQMGTGDSNSKTMERQTWGKELENCK